MSLDLFWAVLGLHCGSGLSLVVAQPLAVINGLQSPEPMGSTVVTPRFSCPTERGILAL